MEKVKVIERMRADWDSRALENARFYINCQKWHQDDAEFDGSAPDVVARVRRDYAFLSLNNPNERRFLEIGCGIGRLMRPLLNDCGEIHGVDISSEMVRAGREWLATPPPRPPARGERFGTAAVCRRLL